MTDITKRLAEALLERALLFLDRLNHGVDSVSDCDICKFTDECRKFLYTAAQEANVQGGERYVTFKDTGIYVDLARYFATPEGKAALHKFDPAAPHPTPAHPDAQENWNYPTPAPDSGEVTDADDVSTIAGECAALRRLAMLDKTRPCFMVSRDTLLELLNEAATRARQGEGVAIGQNVTWLSKIGKLWAARVEKITYLLRLTDGTCVEGADREDFRLANPILNKAQAGAVAAQGEAYRTQGEAVAFVSEQGIKDLHDGFSATAFPRPAGRLTIPVYLIPNAAPVPADEGEKK